MQKIKGFDKLNNKQQDLFLKIHKKHINAIGDDYKKDWIPKKVVLEKDHFKVYFANEEWLHYLPSGTWY